MSETYPDPVKLKRLLYQPLLFPILFFGLTILAGSLLLSLPVSLNANTILSWTDALFTATSATCVTGLAVVDTKDTFSEIGQLIILFLIQIGGLGIMTLTSLALYLFRQKVTLTDRIAVGQNLLQDPRFRLGRFLSAIVIWTFIIELIGAALLYWFTNGEMEFISALFHSISAFCNAGFSLYNDSLSQWSGDFAVNMVFIVLITLGGIGFFVMVETSKWFVYHIKQKKQTKRVLLSWYSKIVLQTSLYLVLGGTLAIFITEFIIQTHALSWPAALLASFFQAVTCRTAGFNTLPIGELTNVTLLIMMTLMFIGAAPGSCGGGIKVTSIRVLVAFLYSELKGREQTVIGRMAVTRDSVRRALSIFSFSAVIVIVAILALCLSETGGIAHSETRGQFLEISFEVISAYATAGISTGITPSLSIFGKYTLIILMFLGRLGPLLFIGVLHTIQSRQLFSRPESNLLIG
jgi:trk system potassium uptake protein TrkH